MRTNNKRIIAPVSWLLFAALIGIYCWMYAPYGFENNDGGFILGLAHQVFLGGSLYDHIIYVRPPVSPVLHSFIFYSPFSSAPIFFDRLFVFVQIAAYSALSAVLVKRMFAWETTFTVVIAALIFVFSAHAFPPMAWHTIDGIFFSVVALYLLVLGIKKHYGFLLLSACFAILAAGSKQPFYLVPIIILVLSLILGDRRVFLIVLASLFFASALFLFSLKNFGSVEMFWGAISSQTRLRDLFSAGIVNYISGLIQLRSIVAAWPLLAVLAFGIFWKQVNHRFWTMALLASIWLLMLVIAHFYVVSTSWTQPLAVVNSVFVITFLYSTVMIMKTRQDGWFVLFAMHAIAWASSISWGYATTILYAAPSVSTLAVILRPRSERSFTVRILCFATLPAALVIFYVANRFCYSLEGTVRRSSISVDMAAVSPSLKFIKATPEQFRLYSELTHILEGFGNRSYVVLPNIPLAHVLTGTANPIGIDWPLNAEVGKSAQTVKDRLNSSVDYAVVYKKAAPKPDSLGKFGSETTVYVTHNWRLLESSENFSIFANPR